MRVRACACVRVRACVRVLVIFLFVLSGLIVSGLFFNLFFVLLVSVAVAVVGVVAVVVVAPARQTTLMFPTAVSHRHTELALRPELNQFTTVVHALLAVRQQVDEFNQPRRVCRLAQTPGGLELIRYQLYHPIVNADQKPNEETMT